MPEQPEKKPSGRKNAPVRPDVFLENSRRQEKPAAAPLPEPPQAPAPEEAEQPPVHTDYKSQFDALIADTQEAPAEEAPPCRTSFPWSCRTRCRRS